MLFSLLSLISPFLHLSCRIYSPTPYRSSNVIKIHFIKYLHNNAILSFQSCSLSHQNVGSYLTLTRHTLSCVSSFDLLLLAFIHKHNFQFICRV